MTTLVPSRRGTPVYGEFDVVVIGGGPAGITAAAAAARAGRTMLLVERYGFLGGAGTVGGLTTFCGLHAKVHGEHRQVIHGLADELLDRLVKLDGLNQPHLTINDGILAQAFDISTYKIAADELVVGSGARLLFHAIGRRRGHGRRRTRSTRCSSSPSPAGPRSAAGSSSTPPATATSPRGPACRSRRRRTCCTRR